MHTKLFTDNRSQPVIRRRQIHLLQLLERAEGVEIPARHEEGRTRGCGALAPANAGRRVAACRWPQT